jgi:von Willebrand factor type A domain
MKTRMTRHLPKVALGAVLTSAIVIGTLAVADPPVTTTLSNGAQLAVEIEQPTHDQEFIVPAGTSSTYLSVSGQASIGKGEPDATIIYVMDESGSTGVGGGTGCSPILGCEKSFFKALNAAAIADGSIDLAGVVHYAQGSNIALNLTSPSSPAVNNAIDAASASGGTNCAAGLASALTVANSAANTNGTTIVVFASDGLCNTGGQVAPAALALGNAGVIVHSVAIGTDTNCESNEGTGSLDQIPQNGGSCTAVPNPGNLPNIIQNLIGSSLNALAIGHPAFTPIPNTEISLPLPQPGAVSVTYGTLVTDLVPATHNLCVRAEGSDVLGDSDSVTDCHTVQLLQLTASPAAAANNLNFDNAHQVDAAIVGGTGPARNINFVVGGHNAGSAAPPNGSILATPNTPVAFNYTVPKSCKSLGADTITVSTQIAGVPDSIVVTKTWFDDVAPTVTCDPTVNPGGKNEPKAPGNGGQGQNQDGFYRLNAADPNLADCTVTLVVKDGDGFVFPGPFLPGDRIKYTQADGAPQEQKKMGNGDVIKYHLKGHGDLTVTGTDPSGNSASASCLVPPAPK